MQETLDLQIPELDQPAKRVLVAGGGSGIGLAIARAFYAEGARVHIGEASPKVLAEVLGNHPGLHGSAVDFSSSRDVEALFSEALEWMEGLDVLVNAALVEGPRASLENLEVEDFERTLRLNLVGTFLCVREAARTMRGARRGAIINIASTSARTGLPGRTPFVAAMAGILGLTRNAARELGPDNIRCNAVLPGVVDNEQGRRLVKARARARRQSLEEAEADLLSHVSMRSWVEEDEVAETVTFLASDKARHISGQAIGVCGNIEWEG